MNNIREIQDTFLKELNQLAGIPCMTTYESSRQCIYVDDITMERMEKRAYDYQEYVRSLDKRNRTYNEKWGFDVIKKYFRLQR